MFSIFQNRFKKHPIGNLTIHELYNKIKTSVVLQGITTIYKNEPKDIQDKYKAKYFPVYTPAGIYKTRQTLLQMSGYVWLDWDKLDTDEVKTLIIRLTSIASITNLRLCYRSLSGHGVHALFFTNSNVDQYVFDTQIIINQMKELDVYPDKIDLHCLALNKVVAIPYDKEVKHFLFALNSEQEKRLEKGRAELLLKQTWKQHNKCKIHYRDKSREARYVRENWNKIQLSDERETWIKQIILIANSGMLTYEETLSLCSNQNKENQRQVKSVFKKYGAKKSTPRLIFKLLKDSGIPSLFEWMKRR